MSIPGPYQLRSQCQGLCVHLAAEPENRCAATLHGPSHPHPPNTGCLCAGGLLLLALDGGQSRHAHAQRGAHGRAHVHALPVHTLGTRGLVGINGLLDGLQVGQQLVLLEVNTAKQHVQVAGLVQAVLHLATLEVLHGSCHISGDCASLGVGHQTAGTQHTTQLGHLGHHVRSGNQLVELQEAAVDLLNKVIATEDISASCLSSVQVSALCQHCHTQLLASASRQ
mmetsp:Transcript_35933/g.90747  ORF Transcript_35933/g.90747 Transcript_35933/m.90747 type:complete len:225 (-) Transcript_35933:446-1120(-)